jgi:HEAT repeat protein
MEQAVSSPKTVRQQEAIAPVDDSSASRQSHTSQPTQTESSDGSTVDAAAPHLPETLTHPASFSATTRLARVDIVEELIRDLHSSEPDKRRKAIWELGQRGDSRAVQPLVDLLTDSDSNQRSLILAAVSEIGMRSLKPINRALLLSIQDDSADVRKNAIRDVTRIYDLVAQISQLLQHAAGDSDRDVQETAQWALTQLNRIRPASDPDSVSGLPGRMNSAAIESLSEDTQS